MLESMITSPVPTRAEVSDIANAVLDNTDAIMLSAETATGRYPAKAVEAMSRAALAVEKHPEAYIQAQQPEPIFTAVDEAIAMAAMYTANHLNIKAIVALTESGTTPLWMSRIRSGIPIYALSRNLATQRAMALYRGVFPIAFDPTQVDRRHLNQKIISCLQERGILSTGDLIIITKGDTAGVHGKTNTLKIYEVGTFKQN
jgi:pyruvate kinase